MKRRADDSDTRDTATKRVRVADLFGSSSSSSAGRHGKASKFSFLMGADGGCDDDDVDPATIGKRFSSKKTLTDAFKLSKDVQAWCKEQKENVDIDFIPVENHDDAVVMRMSGLTRMSHQDACNLVTFLNGKVAVVQVVFVWDGSKGLINTLFKFDRSTAPSKALTSMNLAFSKHDTDVTLVRINIREDRKFLPIQNSVEQRRLFNLLSDEKQELILKLAKLAVFVDGSGDPDTGTQISITEEPRASWNFPVLETRAWAVDFADLQVLDAQAMCVDWLLVADPRVLRALL